MALGEVLRRRVLAPSAGASVCRSSGGFWLLCAALGAEAPFR